MFRKAPLTAAHMSVCPVLGGCEMTHNTDPTVCQPSFQSCTCVQENLEPKWDTRWYWNWSLDYCYETQISLSNTTGRRCGKIKFKFTVRYFNLKDGYCCTRWLRLFLKGCGSVTHQWCEDVLVPDCPEHRSPTLSSRERGGLGREILWMLKPIVQLIPILRLKFHSTLSLIFWCLLWQLSIWSAEDVCTPSHGFRQSKCSALSLQSATNFLTLFLTWESPPSPSHLPPRNLAVLLFLSVSRFFSFMMEYQSVVHGLGKSGRCFLSCLRNTDVSWIKKNEKPGE